MIVTINQQSINFLTVTVIKWQVDQKDQIIGATVSFINNTQISLQADEARMLYGAVIPQPQDQRIVKPDLRLN